MCIVAEFAFNSTDYTVVEDEGNATVAVSLINGILDRLLAVTVTPSSFQAIGTDVEIIIMHLKSSYRILLL